MREPYPYDGPLEPPPRPTIWPWLALVFVAFAFGVFAERSGWIPSGRDEPRAELRATFKPFWEAWHLVETRYVDRNAVKPERMTQGAIEGMLASLGDIGHTTYLTAKELAEVERGLKGEFEGIGAQMTMRKRRPTV